MANPFLYQTETRTLLFGLCVEDASSALTGPLPRPSVMAVDTSGFAWSGQGPGSSWQSAVCVCVRVRESVCASVWSSWSIRRPWPPPILSERQDGPIWGDLA